MAVFIGKGQFEPYSRTLKLDKPYTVESLSDLLNIPEDLAENLIAVRDNKKLNFEDLVYDSDEIVLFLAVMGG